MVHYISRRAPNAQKSTSKGEARFFEGQGGNDRELSATDWAKQVRNSSKSGDVLVCVHGFNTTAKGALASTAVIKLQLGLRGYRGAVITYIWPTDAVSRWPSWIAQLWKLPSTYVRDKNTANTMEDFMLQDLKPLFEDRNVKLHLLGHSMGAYMSLQSLFKARSWLGGRKPFGQIFLGAADIAQTEMGVAKGGTIFADSCARVTHYHSGDDNVLDLGGKIMSDGKLRSGREGLPDDAPAEIVSIDMKKRFRTAIPQSKRWTGTTHNWYFTDDVFIEDMVRVLKDQSANTYPTRQHINGRKWEMTERKPKR